MREGFMSAVDFVVLSGLAASVVTVVASQRVRLRREQNDKNH